MVIEKCSIAQVTKDHRMKNQDLSIVELVSKRNKIVYTICGLRGGSGNLNNTYK